MLVIALASALVLAGSPVSAHAQVTLPAFDVVARDGTTISSAALSEHAQWLLIYVQPPCSSCDRLLKALAGWRSAAIDERTIVIVGGTPSEAETYLAKVAPAARGPINWYADPQRRAHAALKLAGAPALLGIKQRQIAWTLAGVLNDPAAIEPVVRAWVEGRER
jgi:hypothetical protein